MRSGAQIGVPDERIVRLPRAENFWQAGATGPCGPCSEMYIDRGPEYGGDDLRPGDDTDRYLEYWNHVFMTYELHEDGSLTDLPQRNIDTGLGLERMAVIQQGVDSVFDTDAFAPLIELAEELSGHEYGSDAKVTRAMRIIADHSRGAVNLIADGVVPSNEERGYVLRRIMRRAIQQGRVLGLEPPYLGRFAERAIELMGGAYPHLEAERASIVRWVADEEESFGRTLDRGTELLAKLDRRREGFLDLVDRRRRRLPAARHLRLPVRPDQGAARRAGPGGRRRRLRGADGGAARRVRAPAAPSQAPDRHERGDRVRLVRAADRLRRLRASSARSTSVAAATELGDDAMLVKLEESPFYAEGGGQVADSGVIAVNGSEARVEDVYRIGDDQAIKLAGGERRPASGDAVEARVDHELRHATMRNHTATHLLHAALRERLGTHVRQAGSAVRPDKLRFDFTHGAPLGAEELRAIEDRVNGWVKASRPVRALEMERAEAEALGAMALFGEKYGDWVRMVEVDEVSRELCGGTHVANTAEVGIVAIVSEGSSAANVRRIEALTGPAAIDHYRERSDELEQAGALLGSPRDPLGAARRAAERLAELEGRLTELDRREAGEDADRARR